MKIYSQQAFSVLEYIFVCVLAMASLMAMGPYIQRAMQGYYRKAGETFADLRQHDPQNSQDCSYDDQLNIWYSEKCFDHRYVPNCKAAGSDDINARAYCRSNVASCGSNATVLSKCPQLCCERLVKVNCQSFCSSM